MKKVCCHCGQKKPIDEFFKHKNTADGHWHWCKECEREVRLQTDEIKYLASFSGGKNSTAMLILLLEKKWPLDGVVYFDCGDWEFPEMREHIEKVKNVLGIKIDTVKTVRPWNEYLAINGWATPQLRWCTNEKINAIRRYARFYRPNIQYIGFAADEMRRVNKAQKQNEKTNRRYNGVEFPLVEFGVTEAMAFDICKAHGFNFGGLYEHRNRVSCWCCPLQRTEQILLLKKTHPKLFKKMIKMDNMCNEKYRNKNLEKVIGG